ncbi:uncharacterized protein B0H64DRAFT_293732, partial [Chaetomium fimeti]
WANPADVSTILMIISGDVVKKAFAQSTGKLYTPMCFSFGCVAYAFTALIGIMGDGRLLLPPDYPVKVFNLESGNSKENHNWVLGRILRDLETVGKGATAQLATTLLQLGVAAIPAIPTFGGDWSVLFITAVGTLLIQMIGVLPQWVAEKLPNRQHARGTFALTAGNGSRDVMVILGAGRCLDLEQMANAESPRKGWLASRRQSRFVAGLPFGFWLTRVVLIMVSIFSLLLLVNVTVTKDHGWYILLIGALGMFQNGVLAGMGMSTAVRNLPLRRLEVARTKKVMDGIMDFHAAYPKLSRCLLREFFPGPLREAEERWWNGDFEPYERLRQEDPTRGTPR